MNCGLLLLTVFLIAAVDSVDDPILFLKQETSELKIQAHYSSLYAVNLMQAAMRKTFIKQTKPLITSKYSLNSFFFKVKYLVQKFQQFATQVDKNPQNTTNSGTEFKILATIPKHASGIKVRERGNSWAHKEKNQMWISYSAIQSKTYVWIFLLDKRLRLNLTIHYIYLSFQVCTLGKLQFVCKETQKKDKKEVHYCGTHSNFATYFSSSAVNLSLFIDKKTIFNISSMYTIMDKEMFITCYVKIGLPQNPELLTKHFAYYHKKITSKHLIQVLKYMHIQINTSTCISCCWIFDGPGHNTSILNSHMTNTIAKTSSFQCTLYSLNKDNEQEELQFKSVTPEHQYSKYFLIDKKLTSFYETDRKQLNHQINQVTSNNYLKLSLDYLSYKDNSYLDTCILGGVTIYDTSDQNKDFMHRITICKEHAHYSKIKSFFSIHSTFLLVLYSYTGYSHLTSQISFGSTKCRAITIDVCKMQQLFKTIPAYLQYFKDLIILHSLEGVLFMEIELDDLRNEIESEILRIHTKNQPCMVLHLVADTDFYIGKTCAFRFVPRQLFLPHKQIKLATKGFIQDSIDEFSTKVMMKGRMDHVQHTQFDAENPKKVLAKWEKVPTFGEPVYLFTEQETCLGGNPTHFRTKVLLFETTVQVETPTDSFLLSFELFFTGVLPNTWIDINFQWNQSLLQGNVTNIHPVIMTPIPEVRYQLPMIHPPSNVVLLIQNTDNIKESHNRSTIELFLEAQTFLITLKSLMTFSDVARNRCFATFGYLFNIDFVMKTPSIHSAHFTCTWIKGFVGNFFSKVRFGDTECTVYISHTPTVSRRYQICQQSVHKKEKKWTFTWQEAQKHCMEQEMSLPCFLTSDEENDFLALWKDATKLGFYWGDPIDIIYLGLRYTSSRKV